MAVAATPRPLWSVGPVVADDDYVKVLHLFLPLLLTALGLPYGFLLYALRLRGAEFLRFGKFHATCFLVALAVFVGIPRLLKELKEKGLCGKNLNQREGTDRVPEPGSLWACVIYLLFLFVAKLACPVQLDHPLYDAALAFVGCMVLLGLVDDVVPLGLLAKVVTTLVAVVPLCMMLDADKKLVAAVMKPFLGKKAGDALWAYYVGAALLATFFANAINIHAGINGLEVGESLIIACFVLARCAFGIAKYKASADSRKVLLKELLFSVRLTLPFVAVSVPLLSHNWFPASLFVGNVYTALAGAVFAAVAALCHCHRFMLAMFVPQAINFLLSVPQLLGIKHCPRFRGPRYNYKTRLLEYTDNYTLLNAILRVFGPMTELKLCVYCLVFQFVCCLVGFLLHL